MNRNAPSNSQKWILENVEQTYLQQIFQLKKGMVILTIRKVDYKGDRGIEMEVEEREVKQIRGNKLQLQTFPFAPFWTKDLDIRKLVVIKGE